MTTSQYDVAVPSLTAKYNNSTDKLDLTWTNVNNSASVVTDNLVVAFYRIGVREGNFPGTVPNITYVNKLDQYYLTQVTDVEPSVYTYALDISEYTGTVSVGVVPYYKVPASRYVPAYEAQGEIKLLTYTKEILSGEFVSFAKDIDSDAEGNIYIRNGFKINESDGNNAIPVISKLNVLGEFSNITAKNTNTISNNLNSGAIYYNKINNITYVSGYNSIGFITPEGVTTNIPNFPNTTNNILDAYARDIFGQDNEWVYANITDNTGVKYPGVYKFKTSNATLSQLVTITNLNTVELLETIDVPGSAQDLYKYRYTLANTYGIEVGQCVSWGIGAEVLNATSGVITEVAGNTITMVTRFSIGGYDSGSFSFKIFNYYMVAGNLLSNVDLNIAPDIWWNKQVGSLSKGFILNNEYYTMRNNIGGGQDFIKINMQDYELDDVNIVNKGKVTLIGSNSTNVYTDVTYNELDGYAYAVTNTSTNTKIYRKDITDNTTTLLAGQGRGVSIDGIGAAARFSNINAITSFDKYLIVLTAAAVSGTDPTLLVNEFRIVNTVTTEVNTVELLAGQPIVDNDDSDGNGDVNDAGNGGGITIGDVDFTIPPYDSVNPSPITVTAPDPINPIPMPSGLAPNPIVTIRKNWDRLQVLVNGRIIWSYRLSPYQLLTYSFKGYRGWFDIITGLPIETPESAITYPVLEGQYYIFNSTVTERMWSDDVLFTYGKHYQGQSLLIMNDDTVIVDRVTNEETIADAIYKVGGGRSYRILNNQKASSPILPRWIVDLLITANLWEYLFEVQEEL